MLGSVLKDAGCLAEFHVESTFTFRRITKKNMEKYIFIKISLHLQRSDIPHALPISGAKGAGTEEVGTGGKLIYKSLFHLSRRVAMPPIVKYVEIASLN